MHIRKGGGPIDTNGSRQTAEEEGKETGRQTELIGCGTDTDIVRKDRGGAITYYVLIDRERKKKEVERLIQT